MPPIPPRLQISERRLAAARRRRRRGQIRLAGLVVVIVVIVVVVVVATSNSSGPAAQSRNASSPRHTESSHSASAHAAQVNPLTTARIRRYISGRQGIVSGAVLDLKTGREWTLKPGQRDQTASIVKNDILQTVLYQAQQSHTPIADVETDTAEDMIEASDNDDASDLYSQIGGAAGLNAYNARVGLTDTSGGADGFWGETLTTAPDQIKLLQQLAVPAKSILSAASRAYQLSLMEQIDPGENWGATGGVPASGVTVALKNGWVPLTSNTDWEVNTIGWVKGDGHDYLIALLTAHDPSENYGIDTLDQLSEDVYDTLGPAPKPGTRTIQVVPSG